ncbi:unnamed protein product [Dicrocoelium dendriticum]|nr:unnamed protein product [Dicrocoelium dendriticum]
MMADRDLRISGWIPSCPAGFVPSRFVRSLRTSSIQQSTLLSSAGAVLVELVTDTWSLANTEAKCAANADARSVLEIRGCPSEPSNTGTLAVGLRRRFMYAKIHLGAVFAAVASCSSKLLRFLVFALFQRFRCMLYVL